MYRNLVVVVAILNCLSLQFNVHRYQSCSGVWWGGDAEEWVGNGHSGPIKGTQSNHVGDTVHQNRVGTLYIVNVETLAANLLYAYT